MIWIQRREFITLRRRGGSLAARGACAAADDAGDRISRCRLAAARTQQVAAFRKGLAEAGYQEGQNVSLEFRWAEGQYARFGELVADLVRRRVSVIVTPGSAIAALAVKAATTTIPIVFGVGGDPVQEGLVTSLNRPGGNVTGVNFFTVEVVAKRMQLLRELVPAAKRIAVLVNPTDREGYRDRYATYRRPWAGSGDPCSRGCQRPGHRRGLRGHGAATRRTPCSSARARSSIHGVCSSPYWRRATRFLLPTPRVPIPKPAD